MEKKPPKRGEKTVAQLIEESPSEVENYGKMTIFDMSRRMSQISGLKPGSKSIRSEQMIDEIVERLTNGETLAAIVSDPHMPANSTLWNWRDADAELNRKIENAIRRGTHFQRDITLSIAAGLHGSTGDVRRDEVLIRTIEKSISQRNKQDFGNHQQIDISNAPPVIMLGPIPNLPDLIVGPDGRVAPLDDDLDQRLPHDDEDGL